MKKTKTFSVEEKLFDQFEQICEADALNKSKIIQSMIEEFIKEQTEDLRNVKVTEVNSITSEIYKEIAEVVKTNDKIQDLLNAKYSLIVEENKDKIVYKVQMSVMPKLELDKEMTYISKLDTEFEKIKILDNDHKFVTLSNGNKLRIEDFFTHYERAYYLDPIDFLYGNGEDSLEAVKPVDPKMLKEPSLDPVKVKNVIDNIIIDENTGEVKGSSVRYNDVDKPHHSETFDDYFLRINEEYNISKQFAEKIYYTYNLKDEPSIIKDFASVEVTQIKEETEQNKSRSDFWREIKQVTGEDDG